jgi:hypothetical protein
MPSHGEITMKMLTAMLSLLIFSATACGADLKFTWDPAEGEVWTYVRVYEKSGAAYTQVAQVAGTLITAAVTGVPWGNHTYIARSVGVANGAELESADSNEVSTTVTPASPKSLKVSRGQ